jgi:hypothetical protein
MRERGSFVYGVPIMATGYVFFFFPFLPLPFFLPFFAWALLIAAARDFDIPSSRSSSYTFGFLILLDFFPGMANLAVLRGHRLSCKRCGHGLLLCKQEASQYQTDLAH